MLTLEQIESAILKLPSDDIQKLLQWMSDLDYQLWEQQLEQDIAQGKLDVLIEKVETDITQGRLRDLNEVIDNP